MKVEYIQSVFGVGPDMIIAGSEFKKILDSEEEFAFLHFAVDAFTFCHGFENHLKQRDYTLAQRWLNKNSHVLFVVKELFYSRVRSIRWCEIYVVTEGKIQGVITSEDGERFDTHIPPTKGKRSEVPHT